MNIYQFWYNICYCGYLIHICFPLRCKFHKDQGREGKTSPVFVQLWIYNVQHNKCSISVCAHVYICMCVCALVDIIAAFCIPGFYSLTSSILPHLKPSEMRISFCVDDKGKLNDIWGKLFSNFAMGFLFSDSLLHMLPKARLLFVSTWIQAPKLLNSLKMAGPLNRKSEGGLLTSERSWNSFCE